MTLLHYFFDLNSFLRLGQKSLQKFIGFLVNLKTPKGRFEIYQFISSKRIKWQKNYRSGHVYQVFFCEIAGVIRFKCDLRFLFSLHCDWPCLFIFFECILASWICMCIEYQKGCYLWPLPLEFVSRHSFSLFPNKRSNSNQNESSKNTAWICRYKLKNKCVGFHFIFMPYKDDLEP